MILLVSSSLLMALLCLMPLMLQPLSLGLSIMMLTTLISILIGMFFSSWYSYILFLVFIGGLLVMFAYVSVLIPNMVFSSMTPMLTFMMMFLFSFFLLNIFPISSSQSISSIQMPQNSLKTMISSSMELTLISSTSIMIILGILLLFALLAVVKICYYQQSPLRPFLT
uniref:NADH dehydrogenase subunit 6 n=1 Tax=Pseudococculinidae sp. MNHN-IM-2013-40847 TaxID=2496598 RepID=A0A6B7FQU3_9VEST|nr:NADH dehydrogenase subunit 6 [Pseudococculinidae sp. MNHN-IM-2013-40847]